MSVYNQAKNMPNEPRGLLTHNLMETRVAGLRVLELPGEVRIYKAKMDKKGNILRDQRGNPILGKRCN